MSCRWPIKRKRVVSQSVISACLSIVLLHRAEWRVSSSELTIQLWHPKIQMGPNEPWYGSSCASIPGMTSISVWRSKLKGEFGLVSREAPGRDWSMSEYVVRASLVPESPQILHAHSATESRDLCLSAAELLHASDLPWWTDAYFLWA